MISEATKTQDNYQSTFSALQNNTRDTGKASWLRRLRASAMDRFQVLGFPAVTEEEWKYTNVAPLARTGFSPVTSLAALSEADLKDLSYPESWTSTLVF